MERATVSEDAVRVRINHKWTTKGWRLDETTVEMSCPPSRLDRYSLENILRDIYATGTEESDRRNQEESR